MFRIAGLPIAAALLPALLGCAAGPAHGPESPAAPRRTASAPVHVEIPRSVITPGADTDIPHLLDQARARRRAGDLAGAAHDFDRIVQLDPRGPLTAEALDESGVAWDDLGDREAALARFTDLVTRFPEHPLAREALIRAMRLLCYLDRWPRAGQVADVMLARHAKELRPFEAIVTYGAKALALVQAGDLERASYFVEKGRDVIDANALDAAGRVPRDLAQIYFALGEIRRIRGEHIVFDPRPANFAAVLEERCQLLLDAQSAYSDTMRAYDAHWSAMAGYRVGELYQKLHADLMRVPEPATADTAARRQLFEGAMRLRYSILLGKGLGMIEHTLAMSKRTGEHSAWVERAERAQGELLAAQKAEEQALGRLPYSRADLQAALDRLASGKAP